MKQVILLGLVAACGGKTLAVSDAPQNGEDAVSLLADAADAAVDAPAGYSVARSGSRLKLSWFQTADGVRSPIDEGFYDTMLATTCKPTMWTDLTTRCTPQTSAASNNYAYTDSNCTIPVFQNATAFPAGTFMATSTQPAALCGGILIDHVVVPGPEVSLAATYRMSGPNCVQNIGSNDHYFSIVEIPESTFLEVSSNYDMTGTLKQMHWDSPDGMGWYRPAGYDTALAAPCNYQVEYDAFDATTGICDPRLAPTTGYSDSMCSMPLLSRPTGCAAPEYARPGDLCNFDYDHRTLAVGGSISPTTVYSTSCTPGVPEHADYYTVSGTSAGNVQTLTRVRDTVSTTRLRPNFFNTAGGVHYQTGIFYDSVLNAQCAFDGSGSTANCYPVMANPTRVLYTDSNCTTSFDALEVDDDPSSCTQPLATVPEYAEKVLGFEQVEFHRVTTQHTSAVYTSSGTCRPYPDFGVTLRWRIFDVDPTVTPVSALEAATVVVDP